MWQWGYLRHRHTYHKQVRAQVHLRGRLHFQGLNRAAPRVGAELPESQLQSPRATRQRKELTELESPCGGLGELKRRGPLCLAESWQVKNPVFAS